MNGIPNPTIGFQTCTHSKLEAIFSIFSFCQCCDLINSIHPFLEWGTTTHCMFSSPSEYVQNFKKMYDPAHKTKIQNKNLKFSFPLWMDFWNFMGYIEAIKGRLEFFTLRFAGWFSRMTWYYFVTCFFNHLQSKGRPTMCSIHSSWHMICAPIHCLIQWSISLSLTHTHTHISWLFMDSFSLSLFVYRNYKDWTSIMITWHVLEDHCVWYNEPCHEIDPKVEKQASEQGHNSIIVKSSCILPLILLIWTLPSNHPSACTYDKTYKVSTSAMHYRVYTHLYMPCETHLVAL